MINTYKTFQARYNLDGFSDYYDIYFFGDVHRFAKSCDVDRWKYFLRKSKQAVEERPDRTLFVGMGDYDDFASTREKVELAKMHETTIESLEEMTEKRTRLMGAEMKHMRGRTIGLIEGNHHWLYANGTTTTMDLADRLDTDYLGWLCHYTLVFDINPSKSSAVHLVLCHGKAGGKRAGASINQVEDMKGLFAAADVYCMGHNHQREAKPTSVLIPTHGNGKYTIKQKRQWLCRSGSFKKAYEAGTAGYEISRLLAPADLGAIKLRVGFHRDFNDGDRIITDISAEI